MPILILDIARLAYDGQFQAEAGNKTTDAKMVVPINTDEDDTNVYSRKFFPKKAISKKNGKTKKDGPVKIISKCMWKNVFSEKSVSMKCLSKTEYFS